MARDERRETDFVSRYRDTAVAVMVNDTLLLSAQNHLERRRYRDQIRNASSERSVSGKKPEGGISSAEEIYLNDDVTFDFTFYRFSTVISELCTNSNLYGHNCLCTICTWRTSTPKIVIRANSIADNLLILSRLCFTACMQTS